MKKILALTLVLSLALSVASCKKDDANAPANDGADSKKAEEYIKSQAENSAENQAENSDETPVKKILPSADMPEVKNENDMKTFLAEYEAWVDEYLAVLNKYKNNPGDKDVLLEYAKMQQQLTEWNKKTEDYVIELGATPEVLEEYTNAISRIAVKLTDGMAQ